MSAVSAELTDRVAAIVAELAKVESAHLPVETEVAAALAHAETLAARCEAAGTFWPTPGPFSSTAFDEAMVAALMQLDPAKTKALVTRRAQQRAAAWRGMRMDQADKERRLAKLAADLRVTRAKLEQRRRAIEQQSGTVLPRAGDDPSIWLLRDQPLAELAGTANDGRAK